MPSKLVMMTWSDADGVNGPVDPGYGVGMPPYPSHGLPHPPPLYPSHGLPGGPVQLPVFPFDPTDPHPDNSLPGGGHVSGGPIVPGKKFVVKWLACSGLILVPDNSLPGTEPEPK